MRLKILFFLLIILLFSACTQQQVEDTVEEVASSLVNFFLWLIFYVTLYLLAFIFAILNLINIAQDKKASILTAITIIFSLVTLGIGIVAFSSYGMEVLPLLFISVVPLILTIIGMNKNINKK